MTQVRSAILFGGSGERFLPPAGQDKGGDYVSNYRNFKYYETLFVLFAKQYELARVDESREGAVIQVLAVTQPPERKSKPKSPYCYQRHAGQRLCAAAVRASVAAQWRARRRNRPKTGQH